MFDPEPLLASGREARRQQRFDDARDLFAQAVAESRWTPDDGLRARALKGLGQAERDLRHYTTALKCYREAAAIEAEAGDELAWAHTVRHIADILRELKDWPGAESNYNDALAIYRRRADAPVLDHANALRGLALLKDQLGASEEALLMWQAAKCLYEKAGVEAGVSECESHIAFLQGI